jgi:Zn-dependent peptidase ImmA (M78 family)
MNDDETEQPLTDHLVDQFAAYFLMTMLAFHLYDYIKKEYRKTKPPQ